MKRNSEDATLVILRQINSKLDSLLKNLGRGMISDSRATLRGVLLRATEIADMTPKTARQTDAVELLRQDRGR